MEYRRPVLDGIEDNTAEMNAFARGDSGSGKSSMANSRSSINIGEDMLVPGMCHSPPQFPSSLASEITGEPMASLSEQSSSHLLTKSSSCFPSSREGGPLSIPCRPSSLDQFGYGGSDASPLSQSSGTMAGQDRATPLRWSKGGQHAPMIDSHARLFGNPKTHDGGSKPYFMRSDIFGTGLGSPMTHGKLMDPFKLSSNPVDNGVARHISRSPGYGGGDNVQEEGRYANQNSPKHIQNLPMLPAGASLGDAPMGTARENGGNPLTGRGYYQHDSRVERRRQFPNNQFTTSKLW